MQVVIKSLLESTPAIQRCNAVIKSLLKSTPAIQRCKVLFKID